MTANTPPPTEGPLPPSVSWFMPWRWKSRWAWVSFLLMPTYILSPIAVFPLLLRCPASFQAVGFCVCSVVYWPIKDLSKGSKSIAAFYNTSIEETEHTLVKLGWPRS